MNYQKIEKFDVANGKGIGVVLWVSGCEHHCRGCHNPDTWDSFSGNEFTEDTLGYLLYSLAPSQVSRLTLSGGDPLATYNRDKICSIAKTIKTTYPDKSIWLYTGYTYEDILSDYPDILNYIDVLVDGKFILEDRDITLLYKGSPNQRIIDVKESINSNSIILYNLN